MTHPIFRHNEPAMQVEGAGRKLLKQDESYFSYGEWDKISRRYIPEPTFVVPLQPTRKQLFDLLTTTLQSLQELCELLDAVHRDIMVHYSRFEDAQRYRGKSLIEAAETDLKEARAQLKARQIHRRDLQIRAVDAEIRIEELLAQAH